MSALNDVTLSDAVDGDVLKYNATDNRWENKPSIQALKELSDVDSGLAEGKILIGKSGGLRFEYTNFMIESLIDTNTENKEVGDALTWTGTEWEANKNKIESINELDAFDVSDSPSNKFMYHDGTNWVDKSFDFVDKMDDLSDVGLANEVAGQVLSYNGTQWVNGSLSIEDLSSVEMDWLGQGALNPNKKFIVFRNGKWRNATVNIEEMDKNINKPLIIIISSPSGAGKTSICKNILSLDSNIRLSISVTTRPARDNEIDGKDYHFIDSEEFKSMLKDNQFLEHAKVFNNYYGSLRKHVDSYLADGNDVLFDIDWQGAQQIVNSDYDKIVTIFIMPPSKKSIEERLLTRQKDSGDNPETVKSRMLEYETEISHKNEYKYIVINDNLEECTNEIIKIIQNERI